MLKLEPRLWLWSASSPWRCDQGGGGVALCELAMVDAAEERRVPKVRWKFFSGEGVLSLADVWRRGEALRGVDGGEG